MSEPVSPHRLVLWPRDARLPAAPGRAAAARHAVPTGLAAFDWRLRHALAWRREEAFLAVALGEGGSVPAALARAGRGDLTVAEARAAFVQAQEAGAQAAAAAATDAPPAATALAEVSFRHVLALLRGCYLVLPPRLRMPAVALAAAVAARCGLSVHLACADRESVPGLLALARAALGEAAAATALAEAPTDLPLVAASAPGLLVGTATAFAHAWLRWGGEHDALQRAAAFLGGERRPQFSFASLLLCADGEQVLLDMQRHPLQLTSTRPEDASHFMLQLARVVGAWEEGAEFEGARVTAAGEAALQDAAGRQGGLWAVPRLRHAYVEALLRARVCVADRDFALADGRLRWLGDAVALAGGEAGAVPTLELALRCLQGQPPVQRVSRRAWSVDFLAGYPRLGAAGDNLGGEWRDVWWLHGLPVLGNRERAIAVEWSACTLAALAADTDVALALGQRRLAGLPGLPADAPCLDGRDGQRALAARLADGAPARVLGLVAAPRQLPPGVSSIMLAVDDPTVPPAAAALARRALRLGAPGRWLAARIGQWLLARAAAERLATRGSLVQRTLQERRTYAYTGEAREA